METDGHPNSQRVAEAYQRLAEGDAVTFMQAYDRELRFHFLRALPAIARTHERRRGWIEGMITPLLVVTEGTFQPRPRWLRAVGDELVVGHFEVRFTLAGTPRRADAILTFRLEDARIVEVWDIATIADPELQRELDAALATHLAASAA